MARFQWTLILGIVVWLAGAARAGAEPAVEAGWGGVYRAGRWNPVFVTASSSPPREVVAVVEGITSAPRAMAVGNRFALSPSDSTHAVFFPFGESYELRDTVLTLRDATTYKRIASTRLALTPPIQQAPADQLLIGVSGDETSFGLLKDQFAGDAMLGFLPLHYLPYVAAGYDALDALILNSPDVAKISADQQRPLLEWIRAGGKLIVWPGAAGMPEVGPLVAAMPANVGESRFVELDPADVQRIGWAPRQRIAARDLSPLPDAQRLPLVGDAVVAYRRPVGFGQIVLSPIDLSSMRFTVPQAVTAFWGRLLDGVPERPRDETIDATASRWLRDISTPRRRSVPAWALVVLAFIGPVDSVLLKVLKRRPWTLVTSLGWVGLVAAGAVNLTGPDAEAANALRSIRWIEEIDGAAAIRTDLVALRAPAGLCFSDDIARRGAWWRPAKDPSEPPHVPRTEFAAEQSEGGTWPTVLSAHVVPPRLLLAQEWTSAPAIVAASLSVQSDRITGTLTNRGDAPLENVRIGLATGVARIEGPALAPGETRPIDAAIDPADRALDTPLAESGSDDRPTTTPIRTPDSSSLKTLSAQRWARVDRMLADGNRACVDAQVVAPPPDWASAASSHAQHLTFVRSVVRVEKRGR